MSDQDVGRRPRFSQRHGYTEYSTATQFESLDDRTRVDLWNHIETTYMHQMASNTPVHLRDTWSEYFGHVRSGYKHETARYVAREHVLNESKGKWYEVYDFIEYLSQAAPEHQRRQLDDDFNAVLSLNRAGYRVVGNHVVPITSTVEVASIEQALQRASTPAGQHLQAAVALFAERSNPNYAKVITEAIQAAEAAANELTGKPGSKQTMGAALDGVARQGGHGMHPALISGWKNLYGFTSDAAGIRHFAHEGTIEATQALAQYFLVTCSAFVNLVTLLQASP
jgi:hypothetical protein